MSADSSPFDSNPFGNNPFGSDPFGNTSFDNNPFNNGTSLEESFWISTAHFFQKNYSCNDWRFCGNDHQQNLVVNITRQDVESLADCPMLFDRSHFHLHSHFCCVQFTCT